MAVAELKPPGEERRDDRREPQIQGRIDAIDGQRLYGWVWDRSRPTDRVMVRILFAGRMIASTVADRTRVDLKRNGIGDGAHAFEVELPLGAADRADRLTAVAVSPQTGEEIVLRVPSEEERAAEAAVSVPLDRVLRQLEVLIGAQRKAQLLQRDTVEAFKTTAEEIAKLSSAENGVGAAVSLVRAHQVEIERRIGEIEVFLMRFDKTLAGFDERIKALASSADRPLRRAVMLLAALGTISAASAMAVLAMLMIHR